MGHYNWSYDVIGAERLFLFPSQDPHEFKRFVSMLINDTTYLLDESLVALKKIHDMQELMNNASEWGKLSTESQQVIGGLGFRLGNNNR